MFNRKNKKEYKRIGDAKIVDVIKESDIDEFSALLTHGDCEICICRAICDTKPIVGSQCFCTMRQFLDMSIRDFVNSQTDSIEDIY